MGVPQRLDNLNRVCDPTENQDPRPGLRSEMKSESGYSGELKTKSGYSGENDPAGWQQTFGVNVKIENWSELF